uniref:Cadherin-related family member 3 n=1 Tax=Pogona vitticeps TaxID=103695 RepID=A0ABM5GL54_9SAUR
MRDCLIMDDHLVRKTQNMLCLSFIIFLGELSGGRTVSFAGLPGTGNVSENAPRGTVVYTFTVNLTPNISVQTDYPTIINSNPITKAFAINSDPSLLYKVVTTGDLNLDYETMPPRFELQILVYDTAGAKDLQILTVQLLDENEPPVFQGNIATQTVEVYILESTPSRLIYEVNVNDPEIATSTEIMYSLTPESLPFNISTTGTIYSLKEFDYEKDPHSYILNITARDSLGLSTSRIVIVSIINTNDERPYFTMEKRVFSIPEESTPGYVVVANITVEDPDGEGFIHSRRFSINNPKAFPNFAIDPVYGTVLVAKRIDCDASPFKEERNISLILHVVDSPSGTQSDTTEIIITIEDVNDNPPECNLYNYRLVIAETAPPGSVVLNLKNSCHDIDAESPNNLFNFTELSGVGSSKFSQDPPGSGEIKLTGTVDLENGTLEEYTLNIVVQDIVPPYYAKNIYIYVKIQPVNEFDPVFSSPSYVFNVSETTASGSSIGNVYATDKDIPFTGITYSILAGGGTNDITEIFWIDPAKGSVNIVAKLDYDKTETPMYFTVQASDNEHKTAIASVTVNVLAANDEPPICLPNSYLLEVPVDQTAGTNIADFAIRCTDLDSSPRSFLYSINSGNINNHFTFSPSAGSNVSRLLLASPFDYEGGLDQIWEYRLLIFVTDNNLPTTNIQTGTVTLTIKVIPNPTTVVPTTPGITLVTSRENVYSALAWYVPFIISLGGLLLLGLLGYLLYFLAKYVRTHCPPKPKADKKPLKIKIMLHFSPIEKKKPKKEVVWEMTNINTVFDGEARDPVTGKWYEYNSKSGARRWKDKNMPSNLEAKAPVAQVAALEKTSDSSQGNLSRTEGKTSGGKLGEPNQKTPKPLEKKTDQNSNQQKPKEGSLGL